MNILLTGTETAYTSITMLITLVIMFVFFYFFISRPQKKEQK